MASPMVWATVPPNVMKSLNEISKKKEVSMSSFVGDILIDYLIKKEKLSKSYLLEMPRRIRAPKKNKDREKK